MRRNGGATRDAGAVPEDAGAATEGAEAGRNGAEGAGGEAEAGRNGVGAGWRGRGVGGGGEGAGRWILLGCTVAAVAVALAVVGTLAVETLRFFAFVSPLRLVVDSAWAPLAEEPGFGILSLVAGTAQIAAGATLLAIPVGLMTAVFLEFYAPGRIAAALGGAVDFLAMIPAVVYGCLALNFVTPAIAGVWPDVGGFNGLSAFLALAAMILPTIVSMSRRALRAAPAPLLADGLALGASRGRVLVRLVLPAAWLGILGGVLLALARAVGETMIVTLAAGNPQNLDWSPLEGVRTLTTHLAQASLGDLPAGTLQYGAAFAVAAALFALGVALHTLGSGLVSRGEDGGRHGAGVHP